MEEILRKQLDDRGREIERLEQELQEKAAE